MSGPEAGRCKFRSGSIYSADSIRTKIGESCMRVGIDPLDVGPLRIALYTEPFAQLVAELAYEGEDGPELTYRFEWLK